MLLSTSLNTWRCPISSSTDCCNLALSFLRSTVQIQNLTTDQSSTARLLRTTYPLLQAEMLTSHPWNFCKGIQTLALRSTNPTPVWAFEYAPPGDMLYPRRILGVNAVSTGAFSFNIPSNSIVEIGNLYAPQVDNNSSIVSYEIAQSQTSPTVQSIYTNQINAVFEYTQDMTAEGGFPPKFFKALAAQLAAEIAPTLTNGDPYQIGPKLEAFARKKLEEAKAEDLNARVQRPNDAETIRARGGSWW